ncbi:MAG: hypothetical protein DME65_00465 [Verrucomicrobia bacterium]|nr:MAG: hypothetical protein DME65_00465 [Verrucomicrobiota bacterium]
MASSLVLSQRVHANGSILQAGGVAIEGLKTLRSIGRPGGIVKKRLRAIGRVGDAFRAPTKSFLV